MTDVLADERGSGGRPRATAAGRVLAALRRHWALVALLAVGAAIRVVAIVAIYPGIWFSDSNTYIKTAATGILNVNRVMGYSLVVAPFWRLRSAGALVVVQHAVGLAIVVTLYALLVRRGARRWVAALAVLPAALDGYLVVVEHTVMSETVYHAAIVAGLVLLLWRECLGAPTAAGAGLLLGYAAVVRSAALPFVVLVAAYMLIRRAGWRPVLAFGLGWAIVAAGYMATFDAQHGTFSFTESDGRFLYARTAPFADCPRLGRLPADERALCPDPRHRLTTNAYLWSPHSPLADLPPSADARVRRFAMRVVTHQPVAYAKVVVGGVLHYFEPGHRIGSNDYPVQAWQFPADPRVWHYPGYRGPIRPGNPRLERTSPITEPNRYVGRFARTARLDPGAARVVHRYQRLVYSYGPLLAACLLLVLVALLARRGARRLRLDAALIAVLVLAALVMPQALSVFSYRYGLIAGLLLPVAAGLAATALLDHRRAGATPPSAPAPDTGAHHPR